jgi:hypothetical protein
MDKTPLARDDHVVLHKGGAGICADAVVAMD